MQKNIPSKKSPHIISPELKPYENEIINFYLDMAKFLQYEEKATKLYAFILIHGKLTQRQLHDLTGYALSTISTTVNSLLRLGTIRRQYIPGTHTLEFFPKNNSIQFVNENFSHMMERLYVLEKKINVFIKNIQYYDKKYPFYVNILISRLNSILNYIEIQRRTIEHETGHDLLPEVTSVDLASQSKNSIHYPSELALLEQQFIINAFSKDIMFANSMLIGKIMGYFLTRINLTQKMLNQLTGISLASISKTLRFLQKQNYIIKIAKRSSRDPAIYTMPSPSFAFIRAIIKNDELIYQSKSKFVKLRDQLKNEHFEPDQRVGYQKILGFFERLILAIDDFKQDAQILRAEFEQLKIFLNFL